MSLDNQDLYERYFDKVYKTIFYIVKDQELSKDATQETFIKVFKNKKLLKDRTKVESWMVTIATRTAIDFYNKRKKRGQVAELNEEIVASEAEMSYEDHDQLEHYLSDIGPEQKQILILRYFNNLSEKEIASQLNIKLGTVKSRLFRAKKKLLEMYQSGGVFYE